MSAPALPLLVTLGDACGIGPEIVDEAVKVLNVLDLNFELESAPVGGAAYEAAGHPLPEATLIAHRQASLSPAA